MDYVGDYMDCRFLIRDLSKDNIQLYCKKKGNNLCSVIECRRCEQREFEPEVIVKVGVGRCDTCPYVHTEMTPRAGYALDYYCKATPSRKMIVGYVEYDHEIPEVPDWCPFREDT